jgi:hypothetical protein
MEDLYAALGFKKPEYLSNRYGIKIYIGTKDREDWCVEIPKELAKKKYSGYNCKCNYGVYLVSEKYALEVAKVFTELAKR